MSTVNTAAVAQNCKYEENTESPLQQINEILKVCQFGWFQARILFTAFFAFVSGLCVSNTTPYILPNAECDLDMNLLQKGVLNASPYVGMILVCLLAGFLTDTFGRKPFLVWGFTGIAFFTIISSLSQTYEMLLFAKFFEGILLAAAFGASMIYTSEFCHNGVRDRVLLLQSSYQSAAQVLLALISWGILTQEWKLVLFDGLIVMNAWNYYLLIISLFSLTAVTLYIFLPESPKYLLTQHRYDEAREILINMYITNTGKARKTFPYLEIWKDSMETINEEPKERLKASFKHQLVTGLHNIKPMFRKPLGPYLALFTGMNFCVMMLYNVIRLWFPQLSTIVEHYSNDADPNQDMCVILDTYTQDLRLRAVNITTATVDACVPAKSGTETYINTIILGSVCILPYMLSGALVNKVGKKNLESVAGICAVALTLGLRWASTKSQVVALFAADMALSQMMLSLLQALTIQVFPTTSRTLALSMIMFSGRIGSLLGNIMFPVLLNIGCSVPFYTLTGFMTFITTLTFFLPDKKN